MKITHHTKNQKDLKLREKKKSIDVNSELADIRTVWQATLITMFQQAITNMIETNEKIETKQMKVSAKKVSTKK